MIHEEFMKEWLVNISGYKNLRLSKLNDIAEADFLTMVHDYDEKR